MIESVAATAASTDDQLDAWVGKIGQKPMPVVDSNKAAVLEVLDTPGRSLSDILPIVDSDPMLAVLLLRRINTSRQRGDRQPVAILDSAVNLLGRSRSQRLIEVATTTGTPSARRDDYLRLVERARLAADFSEAWARARGNLSPKEIRVAALLRSLGELALAWYGNKGYRALRMAEYGDKLAYNSAACRRLGFSTLTLGERLARYWHLPPTVVSAMDTGQYQEHRVLAPMLANELARLVVDGWYREPVTRCLELVADYLGVSVGEATRLTHVCAVESARSVYRPSALPAAALLVSTGGSVPLPDDYPVRPTAGPPGSRRAAVSIDAGARKARPIPVIEPGSRARGAKPADSQSAYVPVPVPVSATARSSPGQSRDKARSGNLAKSGPLPSAAANEVAAGPGVAETRLAPRAKAEPDARLEAKAPAMPRSEPDSGDETKPESGNRAAGKSGAGSDPVQGLPHPQSGLRARAPQADVLKRALGRLQAIQSGSPVKPLEIAQLLIRGLHQGVGMPRVVLLAVAPAGDRLSLRLQAGPVPGWPKSWSLNLARSSIFQRVLSKNQGIKVTPDLQARYPTLFPPEIRAQTDPAGFWLAPIVSSERQWGLVYIEPGIGEGTDRPFQHCVALARTVARTLAASST